MATAFQYTGDGYFAGEVEDYGLLPNNATYTAPKGKKGCVPRWNGKAWEQVEDHRGKEGFLDGQPHTVKEPGPLPEGWSDTRPEPTEEEIATSRMAQIKAELRALDERKARPVSVIASWLLLPDAEREEAAVQDEAAMLKALDEQAAALRAEMQMLEAQFFPEGLAVIE